MTASFSRYIPLGLALFVSACATTPGSREAEAPVLPPAPAVKLTGLNAVMGHTGTGLISLFGKPDQDLREANGRRLQFSGGGCVLDAYLYPPTPNREPVVTYVEGRLPDGRETDRAGCVTALLKVRGR